MKKVILTTCFTCIVSIVSFSQVIPATGRIQGIETDFSFNITDKQHDRIMLQSSWLSGIGDYFSLKHGGNNSEENTYGLRVSDGSGFDFGKNNFTTSLFKVETNGYTGIGTDTPDLKLDVTGGDSWQMKLSNTAENKRMFIGWYKSRNAMEISTWGDGVYETVPLRIRPKIASFSGNVGIGTDTPDTKLDITGGDSWQMKLSNTAENKRMFIGWYKSRNAMEISTWGDGVYESVPLRFLPKIASFYGSVGIGTTTPDAKLTVKGKVHAEEVQIDLSVPAPDYVFKNDYNLLSIKEVEKHIQENGHLPNIPSAKVMENDGVALGIMNMKLLEKIEELTLYTIAQEKEIKTLKEEQKQNTSLTRRVEDLEKIIENLLNTSTNEE